jgi:hypothetical protein
LKNSGKKRRKIEVYVDPLDGAAILLRSMENLCCALLWVLDWNDFRALKSTVKILQVLPKTSKIYIKGVFECSVNKG